MQKTEINKYILIYRHSSNMICGINAYPVPRGRGVFSLDRIKIRRTRPSFAAICIALAVTMLFVYIAARSAMDPQPVQVTASSEAAGQSDLRMEGMEISFLCDGRYDDLSEARINAANCAENGGAGMVIADGDSYCVVRDAAGSARDWDGIILTRRCGGITLRISGSAREIAAISRAVDCLNALARETGSIAAAMESGDTDARSAGAILNVYRTRAESAIDDLPKDGGAAQLICAALAKAIDRVDSAIDAMDASKIRLIHCAGCADWISLTESLISL